MQPIFLLGLFCTGKKLATRSQGELKFLLDLSQSWWLVKVRIQVRLCF